MVISEANLVNHRIVRALLFLGLFWISGCGFQLNRNQVSLPKGARTLSLTVSNQTYSSGLDLELRRELSRLFSASNVKQAPSSSADLALSVTLTQVSYQRTDLSLYNNQSYRFHFSQTAQLKLRDQRDEKWLFKGVELNGEFDFETTATELGTEDMRDSRKKALINLAQKVADQLSQNF